MIVCRVLECQSERFITCFGSDSETIVVGGTWKNWRKPLLFTYWVVDMSKHLTLEGHSGTVTGVVMGGEVIVSGGADRQVILWRREDGVRIAVLTDHQLGVTALALYRNTLVTTALDWSVHFYGLTLPDITTDFDATVQV